VTTGVLPSDPLDRPPAPISDGASAFLGAPGPRTMGLAASLALITKANAGIPAASRCLFPMSCDGLLTERLSAVRPRFGTPPPPSRRHRAGRHAGRPGFHLRALAGIAQLVQDPAFEKRWSQARGERGLRDVLLLGKAAANAAAARDDLQPSRCLSVLSRTCG